MKFQSYTDGADGVCYLTLALSLKEVSRRGLIKGSHQSLIERASNESSEYSIINLINLLLQWKLSEDKAEEEFNEWFKK
jgi:hypothetical protein